MSSRPGVAVAEPLTAGSSDEDWLLFASLDDPGAASLFGAAFATRGPLRAFFHGMLFDRDELASSLAERANDRSDAELVLAAYDRWGEPALSGFRGTFALAVIDGRRARTIVARDPVGFHPLFYARVGSSVIFSPEPRLMFAHAGVDRTPSRVALADHLCHRWPHPEETFFQSVRRVPAGSRAVLTRGQIRVERYWDPAPDGRKIEWLTEAETRRFDERFDRAVTRCAGTGRTAVFLSGGLDSISIAALAADQARRADRDPPAALSLGFPDPNCDERAVQTAVAKRLGLPHHLLSFRDAVGPRGLLAQALELNRDLASPLINTWEPAYLALAGAGRSTGVQTILTGYGGDEWVSVSPYLFADLMRRRDVTGLARFLSVWQRSYTFSAARQLHSGLWKFGMRPLAGRLLHQLAPIAWDKSRVRRALASDPPWISRDSDLRADQRQRAAVNLASADPGGGFYLREVRQGMEHVLTSWELEEQHEFGRRAGVRFMHPYWDADLVDMLYRTPPQHLMDGGLSKGLVRDTVARRFPGLGFERQRKVAATSFYRSLLQTEGPAVMRAVGDLEALASLGVVDAGRARTFLRGAFRGPVKNQDRVWPLLNLETWARPYVD